MARFKKHLLVAVGFALAGMIGAAFGTGTAQAIVATLVQIVNTSATPVPTKHVAADNPSAQAVALSTGNISIPDASVGLTAFFVDHTGLTYVVPPGKVLVVDTISGEGRSDTAAMHFAVFLTSGQSSMEYTPPVQLLSDGASISGQQVKFYADSGSTLVAGVNITTASPGSGGAVFLWGHLEDIP
jgi:hypothetical protein